MRSALAWLVVSPLLCAPLVITGQPVAPPAAEAWRPALFKVRLTYGIDADRTARYRQFQAMVKKLTAAGFKKDQGWDNEAFYGDNITGTIPGPATNRLLDDDHVLTALLIPDGYELPTDAEKPVLVRMSLSSQFGLNRQHELADKTRALLKPLNFQEAVGYEHLDGRRLMGWLPVGQFEPILKQTLQTQMSVPGKGLLPAEESDTRVVRLNPIQLIEVIREPMDATPPLTPAASAPPESAYLEKISHDLRKLLAEGGDEAQKAQSLEVILRANPEAHEGSWRALLSSRGLAVDGRIGPLVSGQAAAGSLPELAILDEVSTIRLPQPARAQPLPPFDAAKPQLAADFVPLRRFNAAPSPLARLVRRHEPQRVAVIANDFRGFQTLVGKHLPAKTTLHDFTSERQSNVTTEAAMEPAGEVGAGTRLAVLLHSVAPADEMLLLRIDSAAPYQVEEIARCVSGGIWQADALARRETEIRNERALINERKLDLRVQRRISLDNFGDDKEAAEARETYRKKQVEFDRDEKAFHEKVARFLTLQRSTSQLKGLSTVLLGLYWADGHPVLAGERPTLRFLDPSLLASAAWVQAIPRQTGQTWSGLFRDENGNGVLEFFSRPGQPISQGELNFIRWDPHPWTNRGALAQSILPELPAKTVVQVTLQWREVHDATWKHRDGDIYRKPLTPFRVIVLRQRDSEGKTLPPDLFDVVGRSTGLPDRVENEGRAGQYQISVRFQSGDKPDRYAVRIEGQQPDSTLPAEAGKLPNAQRWELFPRLSVEAVDPASRAAGRALLLHASPEK